MEKGPRLERIKGSQGQIVEEKVIKLHVSSDCGLVIYAVRQMAKKIGFKETDQVMIATAASELSTNILRYAGEGVITVTWLRDESNNRKGLQLFAADQGPGMVDLELSMQEKYSTLVGSLGLGLPSVKRIMDDFEIESVLGEGTWVLACKWVKHD